MKRNGSKAIKSFGGWGKNERWRGSENVKKGGTDTRDHSTPHPQRERERTGKGREGN